MNTDTTFQSASPGCIDFIIQSLSVSYGSTSILNDISFRAHGNMIGLLGVNGSGKTTLLKAICAQLPHTGTSVLQGKTLEQLSSRQRAQLVSYIPQQSGITLAMSVLDVVMMGLNSRLRVLEHPSQKQKQSALDALTQVGMEAFSDRNYLSLSEGEKQLCILARTIVEGTSLLLLDEPDSALDLPNRYHMMKLLSTLTRQQHKTALLCLHDPVLALNFCDQLLLLHNGTIAFTLAPSSDSIATMEHALSRLYGPVSLEQIVQKNGQKHLLLIPD